MKKGISWLFIGMFLVASFCWVGPVVADVTLEVLNPIASRSIERIKLPPRVADLNNKKIALYPNEKPNSGVAIARVKELLEARFTGATFKIVEGYTTIGENGGFPKKSLADIKAWKPDVMIASQAD